MNNILNAFLMTLIAGLSTGVGSAIALFAKKTNTKFLAVSLGFSAGVMIYVSMIELLSNAVSTLGALMGTRTGEFTAVCAFFAGIVFIGIIDRLVPSEQNLHEFKHIDESNPEPADGSDGDKNERQRLLRTGMLMALVIAVHNFPEGLATFITVLEAPEGAVPIVAAIAIHNIPEGIAVSVPLLYALGSRKKAFLYSFASGLAEPLGAIIGYVLLMPFLSPQLMGILHASVAGIMVFISLDELLPAAHEYGHHHLSMYGLVAGMALMAVSLLLS